MGSLTVGLNRLSSAGTIGLTAICVDGVAVLPLSLRGVGAWSSDTEFDELIHKEGEEQLSGAWERTNRRFLFGISGDVLFDFPDPFVQQAIIF